jgi:hypothetical protein
MEDNRMADLTYGINHQVRALAQALAASSPDFAEFDGEWKHYNVAFETATWYNGRERGLVFTMSHRHASSACLNIAVFEHRNHDGICAVAWEDTRGVNPPTLEDIPEGTYTNKFDTSHEVGYLEIGAMLEWMVEQFSSFYKGTPSTEFRVDMPGFSYAPLATS